ncbi:hypothetical protein KY290_030996 [Solanum tuberosum]|uniref:Uncharacterized protein n=1 Tax=Solanum tuberosum TaxID=4113 RepID=A0ABQ7U960_SOLTU|nr:hypothetical protein KY290_030996 [Solanum tuberosum]
MKYLPEVRPKKVQGAYGCEAYDKPKTVEGHEGHGVVYLSVTTKLVTKGCKCGDIIQVNTGRCSAEVVWTKLGRRKCEGNYSILRGA